MALTALFAILLTGFAILLASFGFDHLMGVNCNILTLLYRIVSITFTMNQSRLDRNLSPAHRLGV